MKNKILLSALSESSALERLNETTGVENDKGVVFEVKDMVSSKIAIMGTNKIPEVHDLIGLGIVDVFGKSYGFSVEDKSRKKNYSIRYVHGKGFMNGYIEIKLNK